MEEYSISSVYSTSESGMAGRAEIAGIMVIDVDFYLEIGRSLFHLNWNRWSSSYLFWLFPFLESLLRS